METAKVLVVGSRQTSETACAISALAAGAGLSVVLRFDEQVVCQKATEGIRESLDARVARGELSGDGAADILSRIGTTTDLADGGTAQVAIETVREQDQSKRKALAELDRVCPPQMVFASNTSTIGITGLATSVKRPERLIGAHFVRFSPITKVLEVARGGLTSDETVAAIESLARVLGQVVVRSEDSPGLLSSRIWLMYINESANSVYNKMGTPEGLRMLGKAIAPGALSPLESADFIGIDNCVDLLQNLFQACGNLKYYPSPLLTHMVSAGQLGRKTGRGFFNYV